LEPRKLRLEEFFRRLQALPPANNFEEALRQVATTLNQVEDEFTAIPCNPETWATDGRMYPPQEDSKRLVPDHPQLVRFRSRHHSTYISSNGAIQIHLVTGSTEVPEEVIFSKPGANGKGAWQK